MIKIQDILLNDDSELLISKLNQNFKILSNSIAPRGLPGNIGIPGLPGLPGKPGDDGSTGQPANRITFTEADSNWPNVYNNDIPESAILALNNGFKVGDIWIDPSNNSMYQIQEIGDDIFFETYKFTLGGTGGSIASGWVPDTNLDNIDDVGEGLKLNSPFATISLTHKSEPNTSGDEEALTYTQNDTDYESVSGYKRSAFKLSIDNITHGTNTNPDFDRVNNTNPDSFNNLFSIKNFDKGPVLFISSKNNGTNPDEINSFGILHYNSDAANHLFIESSIEASPVNNQSFVNIVNSNLFIHNGGITAAGDIGGVDIEGPGTRFMWIPESGSLHAGSVDGSQWNEGNIGTNSTVFGKNNIGLASNSFVTGSSNHIVSSNGRNLSILNGENNNMNMGIENSAIISSTESEIQSNSSKSLLLNTTEGIIKNEVVNGTIINGNKNTLNSDNSIIINSTGSSTEGDNSIIINSKNSIADNNNTSIINGNNTEVEGENSITINSEYIRIVGDDSIAISSKGTDSSRLFLSSSNSILLNSKDQLTNSDSLKIFSIFGEGTVTSSSSFIFLNKSGASIEGIENIVFSNSGEIKEENNFIVFNSSSGTINGYSNIAIHNSGTIDGANSIALHNNGDIESNNSISLHSSGILNSDANNTLAIFNSGTIDGENSIALHNNANINSDNSISLHSSGTLNSGANNTLAIFNRGRIGGENSIVLHNNANIDSDNSISLHSSGTLNSGANNTLAIFNRGTIDAENSIALHSDTDISGSNGENHVVINSSGGEISSANNGVLINSSDSEISKGEYGLILNCTNSNVNGTRNTIINSKYSETNGNYGTIINGDQTEIGPGTNNIIMIGTGSSASNKLTNNTSDSLMVGFNAKTILHALESELFVGGSSTDSNFFETGVLNSVGDIVLERSEIRRIRMDYDSYNSELNNTSGEILFYHTDHNTIPRGITIRAGSEHGSTDTSGVGGRIYIYGPTDRDTSGSIRIVSDGSEDSPGKIELDTYNNFTNLQLKSGGENAFNGNAVSEKPLTVYSNDGDETNFQIDNDGNAGIGGDAIDTNPLTVYGESKTSGVGNPINFQIDDDGNANIKEDLNFVHTGNDHIITIKPGPKDSTPTDLKIIGQEGTPEGDGGSIIIKSGNGDDSQDGTTDSGDIKIIAARGVENQSDTTEYGKFGNIHINTNYINYDINRDNVEEGGNIEIGISAENTIPDNKNMILISASTNSQDLTNKDPNSIYLYSYSSRSDNQRSDDTSVEISPDVINLNSYKINIKGSISQEAPTFSLLEIDSNGVSITNDNDQKLGNLKIGGLDISYANYDNSNEKYNCIIKSSQNGDTKGDNIIIQTGKTTVDERGQTPVSDGDITLKAGDGGGFSGNIYLKSGEDEALLSTNTGDNNKIEIGGEDTNNCDLEVFGNIEATGDITGLTGSDKNLKENIKPLNSTLDIITLLKPVSFQWNEKAREKNPSKTKEETYGLIAQEVQEIIPNIVGEKYGGEYLGIDYQKLIPFLIAGIKEQQEQINNMNHKIKELEEKLNK